MSNSRSADEYRAIVKQAQVEGKLLVTKFFTEDCYVSVGGTGVCICVAVRDLSLRDKVTRQFAHMWPWLS